MDPNNSVIKSLWCIYFTSLLPIVLIWVYTVKLLLWTFCLNTNGKHIMQTVSPRSVSAVEKEALVVSVCCLYHGLLQLKRIGIFLCPQKKKHTKKTNKTHTHVCVLIRNTSAMHLMSTHNVCGELNIELIFWRYLEL